MAVLSHDSAYRIVEIVVDGGLLSVGIWGSAGPVVCCSHGITGNHVSFAPLAAALGGGFRLVAPDHRGRGRSRDIQGPWGMRAHAADIVAALDQLGIATVDVLLGHSMGGFVAAVTAAEYPQRVGRVLLVDGGLPPFEQVPEDVDVEQLIRAVIGPAMDRLDMTFASRQAYHDFWRRHPAIGGDWSAHVERYLDYDLMGEPPNLRPRTRKDAVVADTKSQLVEGLVPRSLTALRAAVRFLRAPRGILNDSPLYTEERIEPGAGRIGRFSATTIPDVNHYTILLAERGARAVAAEVRALLGS